MKRQFGAISGNGSHAGRLLGIHPLTISHELQAQKVGPQLTCVSWLLSKLVEPKKASSSLPLSSVLDMVITSETRIESAFEPTGVRKAKLPTYFDVLLFFCFLAAIKKTPASVSRMYFGKSLLRPPLSPHFYAFR